MQNNFSQTIPNIN